ncbi:hypothetical protein GWI33_018248 [Rhynchophorus ferrugineus]|uniref:Uncharacterized protein n=1 Tax=Rhynchophorus ferrugineus TaxID=354439 RepID=A0A834HU54_RHYFE|nr:hypothetical protein GWI33_018248 [Rhynchophorus ferrugineus]
MSRSFYPHCSIVFADSAQLLRLQPVQPPPFVQDNVSAIVQREPHDRISKRDRLIVWHNGRSPASEERSGGHVFTYTGAITFPRPDVHVKTHHK